MQPYRGPLSWHTIATFLTSRECSLVAIANVPNQPFNSVLDRHRRPLGYVDVSTLKEHWERGNADPVRTSSLPW